MLARKLCGFTEDPNQFCLGILYFCDFSGGVRTPAPSGSAHGLSLAGYHRGTMYNYRDSVLEASAICFVSS